MMEDLNPVIEHLRRQRETWTEVATATTGMKIFRISEDGLATGYCADVSDDEQDYSSSCLVEDGKIAVSPLWIFEMVLVNYPLMTVNASSGLLWEKLASLASKRYGPREATRTSFNALYSMPRGTFLRGREVVST